MSIKPSIRNATYADLQALPENMVGEIIHGVLEAHPRPAPRHAIDAVSAPPFEAISFPLSNLFPYDTTDETGN